MPDETLPTPTAWMTEAIDALLERGPAPPSPPLVSLTYRSGLPDRLVEVGTTIDEITADLGAGFTSQRRSGADGEYFVLGSTRFEVFVHNELERDAYQQGIEVPLAVVSKVRRRRMPYNGVLARGTVTLDLPYARAECDIAVVHQRAQALIRHQQAVANARDRSARLLTQVTRVDNAHSDLHAQVRRHFSALEQMIELLQQRSETAGARRARGVIVAQSEAYPETFCVRVSRQDHGFSSELTVQVAVPCQRKPWNLELVNVDDDLFHLALPRDPGRPDALAPGTLVELNYKPRFGLGRHSYALGRLLREEVEGDWEVLARLVSDPASLSVPDKFVPPKQFFDERLDEEQRAAVAGAVSAPHIFFIQGPPGTGKTTVISEVVRQLTARGERVLLLAPMHVAVDEVLHRVGDADGVLALRASWDDSRVREDLRRFTKDRLTAEFVRKARRPELSRASQGARKLVAYRPSARSSRRASQRDTLGTTPGRPSPSTPPPTCSRNSRQTHWPPVTSTRRW
jgi:AAA domain